MDKTTAEELLSLLNSKADPSVIVCTLDCILGLTESAEGTFHVLENDGYLQTFCKLISSDSNLHVTEKVFKCLINLTADEECVLKLTDASREFIPVLVHHALKEKQCVQLALMVLANVTRPESICEYVLEQVDLQGGLPKLVELLNRQESAELFHFSAMSICNLSRNTSARRTLMNDDHHLFKELLPFTTYSGSAIRRLGVVGAIRNCCFETEYHTALLNDPSNLFRALCLPLAGPEELDDDEMEKLPIDLQYLGDDQKRDPDPFLRKMCIEALNQLCATKMGRETLWKNGIYYILRELHKTEEDRSVIVACENLVDILIGDEPAVEHANLKEVEVPPDLAEKFEKMNLDLLKDD